VLLLHRYINGYKEPRIELSCDFNVPLDAL